MVPVRPSILRCRPWVSRRSFSSRTAQRACSSRSAQPWQGWARRRSRRAASSRSSPAVEVRRWRGTSPPPTSARALRREEARSRRSCGDRQLKSFGHPHPRDRLDGAGELLGVDGADLPVLAEDARGGPVEALARDEVQHDPEGGAPAPGQLHDVAAGEGVDGGPRLAAPGRGPGAGEVLLPLGDGLAEGEVLPKSPRWQVMASLVAAQGFLLVAGSAGPARRRPGRPGTARRTSRGCRGRVRARPARRG